LANIEKNRDAALKQLDIQYASADKAKQSFGFIGITFLAVLFGSVFANDFFKLCLYYFRHLRDLWRRWWQRRNADDLEESLEKVYFKLVKANAKNKMTK
jgi:hypothetical protein